MSEREDRIGQLLHEALDSHIAADARARIRRRAAARRRVRLMRNTALPAAALLAAAAISVALLAGISHSSQKVVVTGRQPHPTATTLPSAPTTEPSPASSLPPTTGPATPTTTSAPTTMPFQVSAWLPTGDYVDGPAGTPHYVMTVIDSVGGFHGELYFLYQDGRTSTAFTYTAQASSAGTVTLTTNVGASHPGAYSRNTLTLSGCGSYLTWASTNNPGSSPPQSCTFDLSTSVNSPSPPPACTTGQLSASAYQGSGGGGQEAVVVVFHNSGSATCELTGYPTAWFVNSSGVRISTVSIDQSAPSPQPVTLVPGGQAATTVTTPNPSVPSSSYCQPATAAGVSVTPPAQSNSLFAATTITICTAHSNVTTTPVTSGSSQNGV